MKHAMIDKSTSEEINAAHEAADWLIEAVACATQNADLLDSKDWFYELLRDAIRQNGVVSCLRAIHKLKEE